MDHAFHFESIVAQTDIMTWQGAPTPKLLCGEPARDDDLASVEVVPQVYMRPEAAAWHFIVV